LATQWPAKRQLCSARSDASSAEAPRRNWSLGKEILFFSFLARASLTPTPLRESRSEGTKKETVMALFLIEKWPMTSYERVPPTTSAQITLPRNQMHLRLLLPLILLAFILNGCTSYVASERIPMPGMGEKDVKVVTIPLPVIATSPNEGTTAGALTAFLLHNQKDEVAALIAPQVNRNPNFGTTTTLYGALYPSPLRNYEFNLSKSTVVNEDYELRVRDQSLMGEKLELNGFIFVMTDGSARFYGFSSDSLQDNESNFGDKEFGVTLSAGYPILEHTQLFIGDRFRRVRVVNGAVRSLPFMRDHFNENEIPGSRDFTAHAQMLSLVYNTLDTTIPTSGVRARATVENSMDALGGSSDYRRYELEAKGFLPSKNGKLITAGRIAYSQALGGDVPFLERSALGGENSLRGYGKNRFIDSSSLVLNLEERILLFRWEVFGVRADWECAPFIDVGGVTESLFDLQWKDLEITPGLGFRAVVRPNIVGRLDVGVSREGPAVFVGLGYPF
jgi:hypothetical protein